MDLHENLLAQEDKYKEDLDVESCSTPKVEINKHSPCHPKMMKKMSHQLHHLRVKKKTNQWRWSNRNHLDLQGLRGRVLLGLLIYLFGLVMSLGGGGG